MAAPRCNVVGASLICPRSANVIVALVYSDHLRILHISSAQTFGGGERYLVDLVNALAARGHELFVAVRRRSPLNEKLELPPDNLIELPLRNALDAKTAGALAKLTRDRQIEIVHAHMARDYPLAAYAVRRNAGAKLIVTRHVLFPLSRLHKLTLARVAKVIAVSHAVARDVGAQALVPNEKIAVIHNGVDVDRIESVRSRFQRTEFLRRWDLPDDRLLVGSVGTLTPLKGYEDLLRAVARVREATPEAFFVISGVDSSPGQTYQSALERLIGELDLRDHVRLISWMDDITDLYCALNIFVSASHSESFGLAIVEAMAAGAAIVATQTEGASEIIQDGKTGRLVPLGDAEQVAQAIISLLRDSKTRQHMTDAARTAVKEKFSLARMVNETEALYREALEE